MTTNTLAELGALHLSRPALDASPVVVAAWYERKATVLDHLADQGTPAAHEQAVTAHHHAVALLQETTLDRIPCLICKGTGIFRGRRCTACNGMGDL
jgi:hypothetical protein